MAKKIYGAPVFFEEEPGSDVIDLKQSEDTYGEDNIFRFDPNLTQEEIDHLIALGDFEMSLADKDHDYFITEQEYEEYINLNG